MKPLWLTIALAEIGVKETPGPNATSKILDYHLATSLKATSDEIPWCSSFANWVMKQSGFRGTNSAAARSWLDYGEVLPDIIEGAIVIFRRGDPPSGHVTFATGRRVDNRIECVGGNQTDQVRVSWYHVDDILGIRWPSGVPHA
jgi:uncharacterized protein (TIGR02594 family)